MKHVKINFVLAMIIILAIAFTAYRCAKSANFLDKTVGTAVEKMDENRLNDDEIDDVEGFGYIIGYIAGGLGWLAETVLWIIAIIVGIYAALLFIFALAARLAFSTTKSGLMAYRILMGFEYGLQGLLALGLLFVISGGGITVATILAVIFLIGEIVYSARNTYSKRILC